MRASGMPIDWTLRRAASARSKALGLALPISSLARITKRRAIKSAGSPPTNIRAIQYNAASGSEPRTDFIMADIIS